MCQGITLLDEALDLARQEKDALEGGAYEEAIELSAKRGEITGMACNMADAANPAPFRNRLRELADIQAQLTEIAASAHTTIKQRLARSRQEKRRIKGYHLAVGQALQ